MRLIRHFATALAALVTIGLPNAGAEPQSPWVDDEALRSRLVAALPITPVDADTLWLGWQVDLEPGWKTYWRYPGETGMAPKFTLLEARNVRDFDIRYPVPVRFTFGGIDGFGYTDAVTIPIAVTPRTPGQAVSLRLRADFMACKDVCIPFEAVYQLDLPAARMSPVPTAHAGAIADGLDLVPDPSGDGGAGLSIQSVRLSGAPGRQRLIVDASGDQRLMDADLFVEPGMDFMIGRLDKSLLGDARQIRFSVPLDPIDDDAGPLAEQRMRVTFTDGRGHAIERRVDFSTRPPNLIAEARN